MSIAEIKVEAYVVCYKCGEVLTFNDEYDYDADERRSQKTLTLRINPCQTCMAEEYNAGMRADKGEP